jgi:hypothetical protein
MTLTRKVNELMHGRVLIKKEERQIQKSSWDKSFKQLIEDSDANMKLVGIENYAVDGGYTYSGIKKYKVIRDYKTETVNAVDIENIKQVHSTNFVKIPSSEILNSIHVVTQVMMPEHSHGQFSHEVYSNLNGEKHYLDLKLNGSAQYYQTRKNKQREYKQLCNAKVTLNAFMLWYVKK